MAFRYGEPIDNLHAHHDNTNSKDLILARHKVVRAARQRSFLDVEVQDIASCSVLDFFIGRVFVGLKRAVATNLSDNNFFRERTDAARQLALLVEAGLVFSGELSTRVAFE